MREIKYRQFLDGQFHYWGFIDGKYISPARSSSGQDPNTTEHSQFTGLHDKNGKEIYEGDIFLHEFYSRLNPMCDHEKKDVKRIVEVPDIFYYLRDIDEPVYLEYGDKKQPSEMLEVIGNIYEHPHLLENNK